jgi:hypothetical protein
VFSRFALAGRKRAEVVDCLADGPRQRTCNQQGKAEGDRRGHNAENWPKGHALTGRPKRLARQQPERGQERDEKQPLGYGQALHASIPNGPRMRPRAKSGADKSLPHHGPT